ncbi:putative Protein transport protein Sec24A [Paratrimastix pyriformis]|uniref:Uncharacterized protein n=1 Tax=Paratrimastix pyriformis TaxID=342808 RepID=A0ABQ8UA87_9EUKA|nr:putative Protein transport protein Sec24A [Paratrimastix pyriformis]
MQMLPPPAPVAQGGDPSLLIRLPSELLLTIMEASSPSLQTYLQMLSLCRATRTAIRGTPRELSFFLCDDDDDHNGAYEGDVTDPLMAQVIAPSPDALAALVGPCKGLVKLTLPRGNVTLLGRSPANAPWVSEAFEGHSRLAVLSVPSAGAYMPFLPGILGLLPGLEELHMGGPDQITIMTRHSIHGYSWAWAAPLSKADDLLAALGRSRPPLRVLHYMGSPLRNAAPNLGPIASSLTDLHSLGEPEPASGSFMASLTSVQRLSLDGYPAAFLRPIGSRLTKLRLLNCGGISEDLADVGLCRLESLQLSLRCNSAAEVATLGRLLGANRGTMRTVTLDAIAGEAAARPRGVGPISLAGLFDPLNGLPHLDDLTVILAEESLDTLPDPDAVLGCLTPGLLDRLAHLSVHLRYEKSEFSRCPTAPMIRIAARRLRTLCFNVGYMILSSTTLELACPCLEALALPEYVKRYQQAFLGGLVMDCPQLRSIEGFPGEPCQCQATVMPHLARLRVLRGTASLGALLPLLDLAPGLRDLSPTIAVTQAAHLARLLASDTLTRLSPIANRGDVVDRTLRLPAQLERLELSSHMYPNELVVDAPGLRSLSIRTGGDEWQKSGLRVALRCPALLALKLDVPRLAHLGLADPGGPAPPLVHLILHVEPHGRHVSGIRQMEKATEDEPFMEDVAGTLELLGARLRCLCLRGTFPAWPQLAAALGRLPRLAELTLWLLTTPGDLVLACPALQRLTLSANRFRSVVFDCPRLEVLVMGIVLKRFERFEPAGGQPPPNLCVQMQPHLAVRFPWLASVPGIDRGWYRACESGARMSRRYVLDPSVRTVDAVAPVQPVQPPVPTAFTGGLPMRQTAPAPAIAPTFPSPVPSPTPISPPAPSQPPAAPVPSAPMRSDTSPATSGINPATAPFAPYSRPPTTEHEIAPAYNTASAQPMRAPNQIPSPRDSMAGWNMEKVLEICPKANAHPDYFRLTVHAIPSTIAVKNKWSLPLGAVIHPLAPTPRDEEPVPVVNFAPLAPVRCLRCRTYINPFVQFIDQGRRWRCNICSMSNEVPPEYYAPLDEHGFRIDLNKHPELTHGSCEIVAPSEYVIRPPQPPTYIFVIDVSPNARESGMLKTVCETIKAGLDKLPGDVRTQVGFVTFDSSVHFYSLKASLQHPQMYVVPDVNEILVPVPEDLVVNRQESRRLIDLLLDRLPTMFDASTSGTGIAVGSALHGASPCS